MNAVLYFHAAGPRDAVFWERGELFVELVRFALRSVAASGAKDVAVLADGQAMAGRLAGIKGASQPLVAPQLAANDPWSVVRSVREAMAGFFDEGPLLVVSPLSGPVSPQRLAAFLADAKGHSSVSALGVPVNANPFWATVISAKAREGRFFRSFNLTRLPRHQNKAVWEKRCGADGIAGSQWLPNVYRADAALILDAGEGDFQAVVADPFDSEMGPLLYALPIFEVSPDEPLSFAADLPEEARKGRDDSR